jgi:hypothetical protein
LLADAPAKKAIDAVVLRKGKDVTLKEIVLPEPGPAQLKIYQCPSITDGTSNTILFGDYARSGANSVFSDGSVRYVPPINWWGWDGGETQSKVLTTTYRKEDRFTARYQEGTLVITLTGTLKNDKAALSQVKVIDGSKEYRYESLDKTAEEYRDKASDLLKSAEANKNNVQIK